MWEQRRKLKMEPWTIPTYEGVGEQNKKKNAEIEREWWGN